MSTLTLPARTGPAILSEADFNAAAVRLGCSPEAIKAVTAVEAPKGGFDDAGRPTILFERHLFHRFTDGKFDKEAPDLSNDEPGGYGKYAEQYSRLERAYALDAEAALKATSWGAFQILGMCYPDAGYPDVWAFKSRMCESAPAQLGLFVDFLLRRKQAAVVALRAHEWATFARIYNGPGYKVNNYDVKLAEAFGRP